MNFVLEKTLLSLLFYTDNPSFIQIFISTFYPPTKSEGYSFGVVCLSIRPSVRPSAIFVCPEPYLSTYWSDLIHSWYKW